MDQTLFPRTTVGGVSVSRMIIGTNWILGWSHTGAAADATIHERNHNREVVADLLEVFLAHAQRGHALRKLRFLIRTDVEGVHRRK